MKRNIEIKARYPDLQHGHLVARELGAILHGRERQRDTYFRVSNGRLKLRERWLECLTPYQSALGVSPDEKPRPAQLIWYHRTNEARARASDYTLIVISDPEPLRNVLAGALGIAVEVLKSRTIYLYQDVRVHLDEVTGLGNFLEFEAVVSESCTDAMAEAKLNFLRRLFEISDEHILSHSYCDLTTASHAP